MDIKIGADPELFVAKDGAVLSGYGLIPGTKENPYKVSKGAVQVDGMALEFNIDPAEDEDTFYQNIKEVSSNLKRMVEGYDLVFEPVAEFDKDYIEAQPYEAKMLGCDPDFNAWTGAVNDSPDENSNIRTAAGHIHIGWTDGKDPGDGMHFEMCRGLVKQLDFFLGLPSLFFDNNTERRKMYGKAGAFRAKPYGVEYRVLSNKWVDNEELTRWVYRNSVRALRELANGNNLAEKHGDIQDIINNSDLDTAKKIIAQNFLEVPNVSES